MQFADVNHFTCVILIIIMFMIPIMAVVDSSTDYDWSTKHFNYLVVHNPPFDYVIQGPNGSFTSYGTGQNIAKWLAAKLKYQYSFFLINQTLIDTYGTYEAAFYQVVHDKDIDGIAQNFYLTMNRVQRMDYTTHPGWVDRFRLVVPRLGEESRLFAFIGPFEPKVWLLVFISVLVVVALMTFGTKMKRPISRNIVLHYLGSHLLYVINILTNQGGTEGFSYYSFRVLAGIWVLCATVLVNSYTGIVISSLTTPKTKPSIDSFEDLAASSDTQMVLRHDTFIGEMILQATSGVFKVLGDRARQSPDNIVGDVFKVTEKLETGRYAFPFVQTFAVSFVTSQYKKDHYCRFKASKPLPFSTGHYSWLFKKKSSYTDAHSRALANLWETGLTNFWVYKEFLPTVPRADQCFVESNRRLSRVVPIQLSDLISAFLIFGIGIGLATLSFLLEVLFSKFNFKKNTCLDSKGSGVYTTHLMLIKIVLTILIVAVDGLSTDYDWRSKHFNYLVVHNPPFDFVFRGPNGTFKSYGSGQNVAIWLAAKLKYTFSFVLINQTLINKYGTHEAAFYQVVNDENVDGIATNFYLTVSRMERMDYTTHHGWVDEFRLVVPRSGEESRLFAFIGPFKPTVWLLVFISVLVVIAVMTLFTMIYRHHPWNAFEVAKKSTDTETGTGTNTGEPVPRNGLFDYLGSHTIYVVNIMTNQGSRESSSLYSFRILAGFWVLGAMVLVNSYTGIVISSLTTTNMKPSIDSLEELAASTETQVLLRHDTSIGEQMLQATSGVFKVFADKARLIPGNIVGDAVKVTEKLETGRYAFPFIKTFAMGFVSSQFEKDQQCRYKMSKKLPLSTGYYFWLFKKNSSYTNAHSKRLLELWETGLTNFWVYNLFPPTTPRAEQCFVESTRRVSRRAPIQLSDLTSAFLILGIGTGLAVLSFLTELLYSRFRLYKLPSV
ncbi:hypothetical protein GHT06_021322 [Daphnia sinensis]|uniref:Ionotropic glutamate receptor C-terminal domain-containing protein n=1 Tax=Daphnia sinensis TaxID=1820382 RepID=A0AAD5L0H1_9CRUS|nr:hypothetical protein GHT06_021322 [Daphnia sinensis]